MSYQRIMVAVDGSDTANLALLEAIHLAKLIKAELNILHINDEFHDYDMETIIHENDSQKDKHHVLQAMQEIAEKHNLDVETTLLKVKNANKKISEKIIDALESWHADLLVMGTHGHRGFHKLFLGSVAEETVRIATIPVLLVGAHAHVKRITPNRKILVAVDGSETAKFALFEAIKLAIALRTKLCITTVINECAVKLPIGFHLAEERTFLTKTAKSLLEKMAELAKSEGCEVEIHVIEVTNAPKRISQALVEAIPILKADLLIMGTHGFRGFNRFLLGSVAQETLHTSPIPLLIVCGNRPKE